MHVITGLPRSGSTLLCNILNQNPRFFAGSTSPLPTLLANIISTWSTQIEITSDLLHDREAAQARMLRAMREFCNAWYSDKVNETPVIFDKSRHWMHYTLPENRMHWTIPEED